MPSSTKMKRGLLGEMADSMARARKSKISLKHLVIPESKKILK